MGSTEDTAALIYVGIGSSAGGLEAARDMVKALTPGQCLTYILAQHLSPTHTSMLVDLIRRDCGLPVDEATDGLQPQANHFYITPPNRDIEIRDGRVRLSEARSGPMPKPDINRFFHSLAHDRGARCIGVILSGTGTDGAAGMIEIKAAGGITLAQDPQSAKYDGMPLAAIHADAADLVLPPLGIAQTLLELERSRDRLSQAAAAGSAGSYAAIVEMVLRETGVNLLHYKKNSIQRRIRRRMSICKCGDMAQYLELLGRQPQEVHDLARDAFIGVTGFFRDPEAFAALSEQLAPMLAAAASGEELRVWVPGCATGEEAYTLAIVLEELRRAAGDAQQAEYRVFATDIGSEPLARARLGHYGANAVTTIDRALLGRYFTETATGHVVARRIRDRVIFSTHDLVRDAPFSRLDLISCRNVMIYFDNELQRQVFDTFHYALKPGGLLMLGMSESNTQAEPLFAPAAPAFRVYRRQDVPGHRARLPQLVPDTGRHSTRPAGTAPAPLEGLEDRLNRLLSQRFAPTSVVVNQHNEIMYSFGDLSGLMTVRPGPASLDILGLVPNTVRSSLRALIYKVRRESAESAGAGGQVLVSQGGAGNLRLLVAAFDPNRPGWLLVSFQPLPRVAATEAGDGESDPAEPDAQLVMALEHELFSTRESLQTVVQELETTNQELQAANEELQASNEEFQSTNEELQTTNEELQSSNEELLTLNDELQEKTRQYERLANQLQNIQESIDTPLLVVDRDLRLTRFVPRIDQLVPLERIRQQDHLTALPWRHEIPGLRELVCQAIDRRESLHRLLHLGDRVWQLHTSPFVDGTDRVSGAVLVFTDTSELHATQERIRQEMERAQITLESIGDGVIRVGLDGSIEYLNPVAAAMLEWPVAEAQGRALEELFTPAGEQPNPLGKTALQLLGSGQVASRPDLDCRMQVRSGRQLHLSYSIGPTTDRDGVMNGAVIAFRDMTDHQEALSRMSWMSSHDDLTGAVNRREMERRLATALNAIQQGRKREAVFLYLDLDQFKVVNDSCGHLAGDELLKNVTRLLRQHTRHRDTVARLGGDEFGVLLEGCVLAEAELVAEKIRTAIEEFRFRWKDRIFRLGISIGIVALTPDSGQISDVLANADAACYAAKSRGRNHIQVHTPDDEELNRQRADLHWVSEITDAMDNGRLRIYMHEIRAIDGASPPHWEALLRMHDRDGRLMLPGAFLPAAERYGLIQRIDMWVIDTLFAALHEHRPAFSPASHPHVNVNLSGGSFSDTRVADHVHRRLQAFSVDPTRVAFEITETAAISNLATAKQFIQQIKSLGCRIALDDFGSGMSSLTYLKELDIDYVKIDGSFIHDIESNNLSQAIVRAIVDIARLLGIRTVAEFATTQSIVERLCELGICGVQGQAVGDPVPLEAFLAAAD